MTKFKGSILSRKLEADPNLPTIPNGHYGNQETGQLWSKTHEQFAQPTAQGK